MSKATDKKGTSHPVRVGIVPPACQVPAKTSESITVCIDGSWVNVRNGDKIDTLPAKLQSVSDMTESLTNTERTIALFAFRYALGRMTYAPRIVTDYILEHLDSFEAADRDQMVRDIEEAEEYRRLGMSVDVATWMRFKDRLVQPEGGECLD